MLSPRSLHDSHQTVAPLEVGMTIAVYLAICAGLVLFLAGCIRRYLKYARTPLHLRWELYPVPHEEPHRARYGGSYFESGQWWLSPQAFHHRRELMTMFQEIIFLKGLLEFNPRLWIPSFLFHFGLYLTIATLGLGALAVIPAVMIPQLGGTQLALALIPLCRWTAYSAFALILIGAPWLLFRRLTDPALRNYTKPADVFNLLFFVTTVACLALGALTQPETQASMAEIVSGLLTFNTQVPVGAFYAVGLVLAAALIAYIPFTHMSHFIAKYFTYHHVRWDDQRNQRGSEIEAKIAGYLQYKPTWGAEHIGANGERTWAEIASTNPTVAPKNGDRPQEVRK
jgi:nitrate reductase gamma subunit